MKLFFLKDHSLYKIFKTLEKIPHGKTIHISIDPEHAFFDNERRGRQIKDILVQRHITAYFITKTEKAKGFFERIGLLVEHQEQHKIMKALRLLYLFFFNIRQFHLQLTTKKNYVSYAVWGFELGFVVVILLLLYSLILPRTIITLTPSHTSEDVIYNFRYYPISNTQYPVDNQRNLSIPFQTGFIDYKYTLSISVENIKHIQHPSEGTINLVNTTDRDYTFIKGTRFETIDGLTFVAKDWFKVKAKSETLVPLIAANQDAQGILIGARGNIPTKTKVFIKNLKDSYFFKRIYGEAISPFSGGTVVSQGVISPKDIAILSGKLISTIQQQKIQIVSSHFSLAQSILLPFSSLIDVSVQNITIENKAQENVPYLKGSIIARLSFAYIQEKDLLKQIEHYLAQRPSDKVKLFMIDKSSLVLYPTVKKDLDGAYIIPTKVQAIQGYDFDKDINNLIPHIKDAIIGQTREATKQILLTYPEISTSKITIRPPRYTTISKLKSRITLLIKN